MTVKITSFTGYPKMSLREIMCDVTKTHKPLIKNFQLPMQHPDVCYLLRSFYLNDQIIKVYLEFANNIKSKIAPKCWFVSSIAS